MPTSYNGWPVNRTPTLDNSVIPGSNGVRFAPGVLAGDVSTVLFFVGFWINRNIGPLTPGWCWGFSYRENRNANNWSCHASATAADVDAPKHPNGKRGTWGSSAARIRSELLTYLEGVVQWGEDYTGTPDGMHFEIIKPAGDVARVAAKIDRDYGPRDAWVNGGVTGDMVKDTQRAVHLSGDDVDGVWGDQTENRVNLVRFAINGHYPLGVKDTQLTVGTAPDGVWGDASQEALAQTVRKLQTAWGSYSDGLWGPGTQKAYEQARNTHYRGRVRV